MSVQSKTLLVAIARLAIAQGRAAATAARAAGVNATSWAILSELSLDGWLTNGQLAERLGMSTGGVTPALDRLVRRGLLERSPNPADRRSSIVAATPEGQALITRSDAALAAELAEALGALDDVGREAVLHFLLEVNDAYGALRVALEQPVG